MREQMTKEEEKEREKRGKRQLQLYICVSVVYKCVEIRCCCGVEVLHFLNDHFGEWIGRRGCIEWPLYSLDLTSCDYLLWRMLKDKVLEHSPRNQTELCAAIETEFETLHAKPEFALRVCLILGNCCLACIAERCSQFEHKM